MSLREICICTQTHTYIYMQTYLCFLAAAMDAEAAMLPVASARNVNKPGTSRLLRVRMALQHVGVYVYMCVCMRVCENMNACFF